MNHELTGTATVHLECDINYSFRLRAWGDRTVYNEQSSGWVYDKEVNDCDQPPATPSATPVTETASTYSKSTPSKESDPMNNAEDPLCPDLDDHWSKLNYTVTYDESTELYRFTVRSLDWKGRKPSVGVPTIEGTLASEFYYSGHEYEGITRYYLDGETETGAATEQGPFTDGGDCRYGALRSAAGPWSSGPGRAGRDTYVRLPLRHYRADGPA